MKSDEMWAQNGTRVCLDPHLVNVEMDLVSLGKSVFFCMTTAKSINALHRLIPTMTIAVIATGRPSNVFLSSDNWSASIGLCVTTP